MHLEHHGMYYSTDEDDQPASEALLLASEAGSSLPQNYKRRRNLPSVDLKPKPHTAVDPLPL